jgi:hypothetical protein
MGHRQTLIATAVLLLAAGFGHANPPVASYIFPAGGQRGKTVPVHVGGLFLYRTCGFEILGTGVSANSRLVRTHTIWFEGPLLPLPASQQAEDYPRDMAGTIRIAGAAAPGIRYWRVWTSQGATAAMRFMVGDLPEVVEKEMDGDPVPVQVSLPVTINGRLFPREDVDVWSFHARRGQSIHCEVHAARLGSPLDARLEIRDARGHTIAENDDYHGADPCVIFRAPADGDYQVRIHDIRFQGGQAFVYRLTLTADPHVDHFFPLGGRRGSKIKLEATGQDLPSSPIEISLPATQAGEYRHHLEAAGKRSNDILLELDDLPEYLEAGSDRTKPATLPAIFNGRIARPGDVDRWIWQGRKGDVFEFDLHAGRLGSPLDGVLTIHDRAGKQLARAEASSGQIDPFLSFSVPADGIYEVRVQGRFRSRGGPQFAYRLRVDRPARPDYRLRLPTDAVTVLRKGESKLKIAATRTGGFNDPITLAIAGLPPGVSVKGTTIPAGQSATELVFKADASARIKPARLTITGSAKIAGKPVSRTACLKVARGEPELSTVLLAVALPTPFTIKGEYVMGFSPRGSLYSRRYKIERLGYDGPIEVSLADRQMRHLQGVSGPAITVPAGAREFTYVVALPPWMEVGRTSRSCVMGVGVVKEPDGSEHEVSFSSVNQNEQMVAVVGPGQLALDLPQTSLSAVRGQSASLPVQIKRAQGLSGPVKLELVVPSHMHGISAPPVIIAAERESGTLPIHFAQRFSGPVNMPITVRATLVHQGQPIVAEGTIELQLDK